MVTYRNCWICGRFLGGPAGKDIVFKVKGLNIQLTVSYFQFLPLYQTLSLLQPSHHPLMPPHLDPQYRFDEGRVVFEFLLHCFISSQALLGSIFKCYTELSMHTWGQVKMVAIKMYRLLKACVYVFWYPHYCSCLH